MLCRLALTLAVAVALGALPALAGAADNASQNSLPGVKGGYRIVKPVQSDPDQTTVSPGKFKIGDLDVHVSGSVIVDVGVGSVRTPKH
jgi:hypothetical protein